MSQTFILGQITGMIERGHQVDVYAMKRMNQPKSHPEIRHYGIMNRVRYSWPVPRNYLLRGLKAGYLVARNPGGAHLPVVARALNVGKYGRQAASLRLLYAGLVPGGKTYDVVHAQFGHLGLKVLDLMRIGAIRGRLVTSFRGIDATKFVLEQPRLYEELFREGDLFLPVSDTLRRCLIDQGCEERKIAVHHSGIDCRKFPFGERTISSGEPVRILTIGRLVEKKGLTYAIRAVARLLGASRQLVYSIVGEGPLHDELEGLIATLGVTERVRLLGWKDQEEVSALLHKAHILMAPSLTAADGDQEGIPNALKEAMASGAPVLGTRHGGIPELVEDGVSGFLVAEGDVEALTERLAHLVDHPEIWPSMGRAGRARVEASFDSDKLNDLLVATYRSLCRPVALRQPFGGGEDKGDAYRERSRTL